MKFRDPKTGKVFEDIQAAWSKYCIGRDCSAGCALDGPVTRAKCGSCEYWAKENPAEAARMMGYEVIEDVTDTNVGNKPNEIPVYRASDLIKKQREESKPRICEVLGVEVGEKFSYPGMRPSYFYITKNGGLVSVEEDGTEDLTLFVPTLVNNHEKIIRHPRWTEQEIGKAKAMKLLFPNADYVKQETGALMVYAKDGTGVAGFDNDMFPSLAPGQRATLDEIIGETP